MRSVLSFITSLIILIPALGQGQWEIVNEGIPFGPNSFDFINRDTGWIAGVNGLFKTTDGGENWTLWNDEMEFIAFDFCSDSSGFAMIWIKGAGNYRILRTFDGGLTWLEQKRVPTYVNDLMAISEKCVYAFGKSKIFKTDDGGSYWKDITPSDINNTNGNSMSACFCNADTGIITVNDSILTEPLMVGKHGIKFQQLSPGYMMYNLLMIPQDTSGQEPTAIIPYLNQQILSTAGQS